MKYTVTMESFASIAALYNDSTIPLKWEPLFVTPVWMDNWWRVFGDGNELSIFAVREDGETIGFAPFMRNGDTCRLIGSTDVCDYFDFVIAPGREQSFFTALLEELPRKGITTLVLESLRPDSNVLTSFTGLAESAGCRVEITPNDVTLEMDLPPTWDDYLAALNTKQRHEVRRKLRRLEEAGNVSYHSTGDPGDVREYLVLFLKMFTGSRTDKADYLTETRETFFRTMTDVMSAAGILRLGILEIESVPAAMIMYFDYHDTIFLYNSGYNPNYNNLSAGLMSKVLCIKDSIESGKKMFDFLKGDEVYKSRLGGIEIPLSDCRIIIK